MEMYNIKYRISGIGDVDIMANSEKEAEEEIDHIFCGDSPIYNKNSWIDEDSLFTDIKWNIARINKEAKENKEMLEPDDYYDSGTIYEQDITFSEVIDELNEGGYSKKDYRKILTALIDDLIDDYFWDN